MADLTIVCCISSYMEGPLLGEAVTSVLPHVGRLLVYEGPAGEGRCEGVSDLRETIGRKNVVLRTGEWATDAAKRNAMLAEAKRLWGGGKPLWLLWLDGDETLEHGMYLAGYARKALWDDEHHGRTLETEPGPTGGIPLRVVDLDGNVATDHGRLIRADLVDEILVSNLIYRLVNGTEVRLGRRPLRWQDTATEVAHQLLEGKPELQAASDEQVRLLPPLPGEPFIVHRAHLRHPARQTLRLHEQERAELVRLGLPAGD